MKGLNIGLLNKVISIGLLGKHNDDPFAYRKSWLHTIYVTKSGNDTTGNGSKLTPYLTITKALTVAVAGDGILLGDGTYAENTQSAGYLRINKNLADWLIIEPDLGPAGNVIITGTTSTIGTYFSPGDTVSHIKFRYLTFGIGGSNTTVMRIQANINNIFFDHCIFDGGNTSGFNFYCTPSSMSAVTLSYCTSHNSTGCGTNISLNASTTGLLFDHCTLTGQGSGANYGVLISSTTGAGDVAFTNCIISGGGGISANGGTVTVAGCTINGTFTINCVLFGYDGTSGGYSTTALISNSTILHDTEKIGHALIFGFGCINSIADTVNIPQAYDYGIVVKENSGTEIKNCTIVGHYQTALYFKAAVGANAHHNTLTGGVYGFRLGKGDTGNKCQNWQLQNNIINVPVGSRCLDIGNDTHDAGGGICDYNQYQQRTNLGSVRNDTAVADLTELQAAWADYNVTTNDQNSTII